MLLSRVRAWFDDATVDVPAEDYFFGFNSPGPNCSSSILGAAHRSLQTVGYGIAFSDYHLLRFLTESVTRSREPVQMWAVLWYASQYAWSERI